MNITVHISGMYKNYLIFSILIKEEGGLGIEM